jgi:hypothetical protein
MKYSIITYGFGPDGEVKEIPTYGFFNDTYIKDIEFDIDMTIQRYINFRVDI